jgi:hypothetical protein
MMIKFELNMIFCKSTSTSIDVFTSLHTLYSVFMYVSPTPSTIEKCIGESIQLDVYRLISFQNKKGLSNQSLFLV